MKTYTDNFDELVEVRYKGVSRSLRKERNIKGEYMDWVKVNRLVACGLQGVEVREIPK